MKQIFLYIAALVLVAVLAGSCTRTPARYVAELDAADSLMDSRPDTALSILSAIDTASLSGELKARHALLLTKAMLKNHHADTSDALINIAVDYYSGRADSLEYQSVYYQGVVYHNASRHDRSLVSLYEAHEKAKVAGDLFYQAMSARELSKVYSALENLKKELEWAEKAKELFIAAGKPVHAAWMDINISSNLTYDHRPLEALELIAGIDTVILREDRGFRTRILKAKATAQHIAEDYHGALSTYNLLIGEGTELGANHKLRLAHSLMKLGRYEEAIRRIREAETGRMYPADSLYRLYLLADFTAHNGNMSEAYALRTEYARKMAKSYEKQVTYPETDLLTDTYILRNDNQKLLIKTNRMTILVESLFCVVMAVGIIVLWITLRVRIRRYRQHAEMLLSEAQTLKEDLAFSRGVVHLEEERSKKLREESVALREESETMQMEHSERERRYIEEMRELFASHVGILNDMCASWYRNGDSAVGARMKKDLYESLRQFQKPEIVEKMVGIIDRYDAGWMTLFRGAYPKLSHTDCRLSMYLYLGFRSESIMMLMEKDSLQAIYNAKYKLRIKLMKTEEYKVLDVAAKLGFPKA